MDLRSIARAVDGEVVSGGVNFLAPGHRPGDRSGRLLVGPQYPDGFWIESWAGDDALPIRDYVRERLGFSRRREELGGATQSNRHQTDCPAGGTTETERTAGALALWQEAHDPRGSPVEPYVAQRGLALPTEAASEAVRFHPCCPFAGQRVPCMVALVRDVVTDEPKAIHRTALTQDGYKATVNGHSRLSLGPVAGGAIKLTPDEDVTLCLGVGEGIESSLSLRATPEFGPSPVWSLLSAGGVENFPVLSGIECLWIAVDHDPAGLKAARACAARWQAAGREVFCITPSAPRADLNDLITRAHHAQPQ